MPDGELPLIPGTLPSPYTCWQALYEQMFELGAAQGSSIVGVTIDDDPPAHDQGWIPTADGVPRFSGYVFVWHPVYGHWVSRHQEAPSDIKRWPAPYTDDLAALTLYLQTYDGGDAGAPGPFTGPMWEVDAQFAGSVPVGVGLIPGSSPNASIVKGGDIVDSLGNGGEYKHVLTGLEGGVTDHVHPMGFGDTGSGNLGLNYVAPAVATPAYTTFFNSSAGPSGTTVTSANLITLQANNGNGIVSAGHNTMQPYVGCYFLKRTARIWLVAA